MFDTHCHLNFSRFKKNVDEVIRQAYDAGVTHMVIPGTDIPSSVKAIEIADHHEGIYAAVGIHPHHVFEAIQKDNHYNNIYYYSEEVETLLRQKKVVAVGEVGLDRHVYKETKYNDYTVSTEFIKIQRELLIRQIQLANKHNKSLILHNREATDDILAALMEHWDKRLAGRTVFHCCEPDDRLLMFAKEHHVFIGIDGDVTYDTAKQEFIKEVPLELLVVETDSPFLLPEPMRSRKEYPNEPKNVPFIISFIARILGKDETELQKVTTENAQRLFNV